MSDEKKNYGIELLRLMSMFYVVIIHILMRGVLESSPRPLISLLTVMNDCLYSVKIHY